MIRAHRVNSTAQDDASLIAGWNIAPNLPYVLRLLPGATSCGVLLQNEAGALLASGAALAGADQPCVLIPNGYALGMVDADLGWHLLLTTTGTESQREIRINPAVDLPDEIHPVYADDDIALARATAAIDDAAHYRDDVTVSCPLGLGAGLGDIVSVPVDGVAVVGQVESITWTATPDGTSEQAVIRRYVAIAPDVFVEPTPVVPPVVANDVGSTDAATATAGNVLANDESGLTVVAVNALSASVGQAVAGSNGGTFTIASDGTWTFDPDGDFALLVGSETAETSVTYHASDGTAEAMAALTITVSSGATVLWTLAEVAQAQWLDASDATTITDVSGACSQLADKSGNSRHLLQNTAGSRPGIGTYKLTLNGAQSMSCSLSAAICGSYMLIAQVFDVSALTTYTRPPITIDNGIDWGHPFDRWHSTANSMFIIDTQTKSAAANIRTTNNPRILVSIAKKDGVSSGTHTVIERLNGSQVLSSSLTANWKTTTQKIAFGRRSDGVTILNGFFCESTIFETEPTADIIHRIEGYLAHKWDALLGVTTLVNALPADHPYKSAPPTI